MMHGNMNVQLSVLSKQTQQQADKYDVIPEQTQKNNQKVQ